MAPTTVADDGSRVGLALDSASIGTWDYDVAADSVRGDGRTRAILGLPPGATGSAAAILSSVHPDDKAAALDAFRRVLDPLGTGALASECRMRRLADGAVRWLCVRGRALFENGRAVSLTGALFDTTDARTAEQALRDSRAGEVEFLAQVSAVLAGSIDYEETLAAVVRLLVPRIADCASIDLVADDGHLRRVEIAHVDPHRVDLGHEVRRLQQPTINDPYGTERVIRTAKPTLVAETTDEMLARWFKDAPEVLAIYRSLGLVSAMVVPLRVRGRSIGALTLASAESGRRFARKDVAFAEELAHRASVAIENARAFREAQEANRIKDQFLATMSHELRTPLSAILGWAALLRTNPDTNLKRAIDVIERNARAQVRLIEEILDVSRLMSGKTKLDLQTVDLASILKCAVDVIAPSANAKSLTLETSIDAGPWPFLGDAGRLQQVFWNLLSNAVKFTPKGGRVEGRLQRSGSEVVLGVRDTGRGIQPDFLPFLFRRFRQADPSTTRTEGGLGLGLSIVKEFAELHGGTVAAESGGEGMGSTFTVRLPVRAVAVKPGSSPASAEATKRLAGVQILVCDDDADARDLLSCLLASASASVRVAGTAAEALQSMREALPDVLVSDIGLPVVDGYGLIRQVRELAPDDGGRTPAIALTAYAGADGARRAIKAGFQMHLSKPFDIEDLVTAVATLAARPRTREPG
jgi:signal transduction histidine kinase/ActR/RegA family two-component response regulator